MKTLSIRQPWAWLIVSGHKDIENRSWPTKFRGKFLIHASKAKPDPALIVEIESHFEITIPPNLPLGAIVGEAVITDCVATSNSDWFEGPHGFVLESVEEFETPIPAKGRLGFFDYDI